MEHGGGWPPGCGLAVLEEIDSTNEEARRRAEAGEAGPLWIMAQRQTAGRGRRGRTWISGHGNLLCTLLVRPGGTAAGAARLSFAAALAVRELLSGYVPQADIKLKWPNDVLLEGGKVAGILLESAAAQAGRLDWLVIGFGVNLAHAPDVAGQQVTALARHLPPGATPPPPDEALGNLARIFGRWYERALTGFPAVRSAWLAHARGLGQDVRVEAGGRSLSGRFESIDADGALVLVSPDGTRRLVSAGEVYFGGT
jgi:BirA family transcriptional regulator, biotin operon repressor / biotin---[acetyl-CoA-carboxylase] ligase